MFDRDLAELYGVETKMLNCAVRRNIDRFPEDFMFQMNKQEMENWKYQFGTSNREKMGLRRTPLVFTEPGVAMLSGILNSKRAVQVNIQIIRTFIKLREMIAGNRELRLKIEQMEKKYDKKFKIVFDTLRQLLDDGKDGSVRKIGFKAGK